MKLRDILDVVYEDNEFILFCDDERVGKFRKSDTGVIDYKDTDVVLVEPADTKLISISVEK